jgi:hypothetical protein
MLALGFSASAQQAIQFTKPASSDPATPANTYTPAPHKAPSDFNAPKSIFGDDGPTASFDILPGSPPPVLPNAYSQQWQKFFQNRKNWALMTPEQVLGVPTPESILGLTPAQDAKLSPEERFLQRQDRQSPTSATNGLPRLSAAFGRDEDQAGVFLDPIDRRQLADPSRGAISSATPSGPGRLVNAFLSADSANPAEPNQAANATWASPFGFPQSTPKSTPEQLETMARFRALMEPPAQEKQSAAANLLLPRTATPDPNMQAQPAFNPIGRSFKPLENDITKPTGITPLAGVTGPQPPAAKKPAAVQPPPWLSQSPQDTTLPQRQF